MDYQPPTTAPPSVRLLGALATLLVLAVALALPAGAAAQDEPPAPAGAPKILLLFDASGSMRADAGDGTPKLEAAKAAARALLDDLPPSTQVGLRLFGGTRPSRPIARACRDSSLPLPIGPLDRASADERIEGFRARGRTPIAYALQQAAGDLGDEGPRTVILVSDGEDTCPPPAPCEVAAEVAEGGIELRIQAIGFEVDRSARRQLECIAKAGGGVYREAGDGASLREELRILSTRSLRASTARGRRIQGGASARDATLIQPGRYVDATPPGAERWYAVDLARGETLQASASVIPPDGRAPGAGDARNSLAIATPGLDFPDLRQSSASGRPFEVPGLAGGIGVVSRPLGVGGQARMGAPYSQPGRYYVRHVVEGAEPYDVELAVQVLGRRPGAGEADLPSPAVLTLVGGGVAGLGFAGGLAALRRRRAAS